MLTSRLVKHVFLPVACLVCFCITACSTAPYQKPIDTFVDATTKTSSAVSAWKPILTQYQLEKQKDAWLKSGLRLAHTPHECTQLADTCTASLVNDSNGTIQPARPPAPNKLDLLMDQVQSYATSLKAVASDTTAAKVKDDLSGLSADINTLNKAATDQRTNREADLQRAADAAASKGDDAGKAKALNEINSLKAQDASNSLQTATELSPSVMGFASWLVGEYIEHMKYAALRDATTRAKPIIKQIVVILKEAGRDVALNMRADAETAFVNVHPPTPQSPDARNAYDKYLTQLDQFNSFLQGTAYSSTFEALGNAHDSLADLIANPSNLDDDQRLLAIRDFDTRASGLQTALSGFAAAEAKIRDQQAQAKAIRDKAKADNSAR